MRSAFVVTALFIAGSLIRLGAASAQIALHPNASNKTIAPEWNLASSLANRAALMNLNLDQAATPSATSTAPPAEAPAPAPTPSAPSCTVDFLREYMILAGELKTASTYVKANEPAPNLEEAGFGCARIAHDFPKLTCAVGGSTQTVSTNDFTEVCGAVAQLYKESTGHDFPSIPVASADVNDQTPVARLEPARLSITVKNGAELQKALEKPLQTAIVQGRVLGIADSLNDDSDVRCMLRQPTGTPVDQVIKDGAVLKMSEIIERFKDGFRAAQMTVDGTNLAIVCVSETGSGLKLGELKSSFGNLAIVHYAK